MPPHPGPRRAGRMTARRLVIQADGGSRGNPGTAGYGAVVLDAVSGEVLAEVSEPIGRATNNVAEYSGLVAGLRAAGKLAPGAAAEVRMDSKLVVEQMSGRWKVKHPDMRPLSEQAKEIAAGFTRVRYEWIPRAENAHADRLANEAMDGAAGTPARRREPERPPPWSGAKGTPTRLLLLRHGQTEMSAERRYSGRGDVPLTELGRAQAAAAAKRLAATDGLVVDGEVVPIIASPLTRTMQTAQAVADALGGRVETHPGLIETDFGEWEGLTFAEAAERDPELHRRWLGDPSVPPPGGE